MADYDLQYQDTHIDALLATANELKTAGYIYKGVATPSTNPGTPTERVAYLASEPGTYTNFGGIVITSGLYSLTYAGGTWTGTQMQAGSDIEVVQTTGQSTSDVMSQKAVTEQVSNIEELHPNSSLTGFFINAPTNKWAANAGALVDFYDVKKGQKIYIESNPNLGYAIAFLSSTTHTANTSPSYTNGCTAPIVGTPSQGDVFTIDVDCYLYVLHYATSAASSNPRTPALVAEYFTIKNTIYDAVEVDGTILTPTYLQGGYASGNLFSQNLNRVATELIPTSDIILKCTFDNTTYKYNLIRYDKDGFFVSAGTSWFTDSSFEIDWDGMIAFNIARIDNANFTPSQFNGLTITAYKKESIVAKVDSMKELPIIARAHPYNGQRIDLERKSYDLTSIITLSSPDSGYNDMQSLAVYGNYNVVGRAREESGKTSYCLYYNKQFLHKLLMPHTGYSALHANTTCFGEASAYNLPLIYCSQWDSERACFVYQVDNTYNVTLVRVIDPANLSPSLFGAGPADWIVGDGFLYSIAYILNNPYPAEGNGLRVCKFSLPTGNGVINLSDTDVIEHYDMDIDCYVRQDSAYHNGKIYTLFGGGTGSGYEYLRRMQVLDVFKKKVVSVIDLQWDGAEPEGISVRNDKLVMMFNSMSRGIYQFDFD